MIVNSTLKTIIFITFELTITALLIIQLYILTKQYALPFLRKQIKLLNQLWIDFQNKIELLLRTRKSLEKKIAEQEDLLENLEEKIKSWHDSLNEKQKAKKIEHVQLAESLKKKRKEQSARLENRKIEEKVIPEAIKQAKEKLKKSCSGDNGKVFLKKVLSDL